MIFGEKLLKLRKENGLSQEALAEKLNTSRQAISKWENSQGYPETEKLLMISNIFNVSVDYLLKESNEENKENQKGYYVSREEAEGFLINENKMAKLYSLGISTLILAYIPYTLISGVSAIISIALIVALGIGLIIVGSFKEENYKKIKREELLFDSKVLGDLQEKYKSLRRKYIPLIVGGSALLIIGLTIIFLGNLGFDFTGDMKNYYVISALFLSIGIFMLGYFSTMIESYEIIVKNEEYVEKFSFKIMKRIREKNRSI